MRVVSITPELDVICRDGGASESTGALFAGFGQRKVALCRRFLSLVEQKRWIPRSAARVPLSICSAELAEALLARDPDALEVSHVRWGAELREGLRKRYSWPWISAGPVKTEPSPKTAVERVDSLVSVVLPTYNGVRYLRDSIESCLNQTHRNLELLVVDDGSTADVRGVVSRFADARLRYLRHDRNQGIAAGLNTGFRNSRGEYLTWTSDDNRYAGDAIETLLRFLRKYPEVSFVYADCLLVDDRGNPFGPGILRMKPARELAVANCIGACFLYRRSVYEAIGAYDAEAFLVEDYDYWIRVSARFRMQRLARPLYYYRYHPDSLTGRYPEQEVNEKAAWVRRKNDAVS